MKIVTRKEGELAGVEVKIEGELLRGSGEISCSLGPSVEVRNLFSNIPGRFKFLVAY